MQYAAREFSGLWVVCTSSQIIAHYLPHDDALAALNATGLNESELVEGEPSTFLATWTAAVTLTTQEIENDSADKHSHLLQEIADLQGREIKRAEIAELKTQRDNEVAALSALLSKDELQLWAGRRNQQIQQLEAAL